MTPDTNTELLMNRMDVCNDAEIEKLEAIIELLQDIRELLKPKQSSESLTSEEIHNIIDRAKEKAKR